MKKLEFRNGICTVLRPLYYVCKVFGLASYSYVVDRRNNRVKSDYGYLNYIFTVICLIVCTAGLPVHIIETYTFDFDSRILFISYVLFIISSYTSSIMAVVCLSVIKRKRFLEIIENILEVYIKIRHTPQAETCMKCGV